uniref:Type 1 membrane protein n=1 Tax=Tanacetum cinerariifolium TaxID=118510 RepID=A0A6L2M979_TANCI|nr:type 1 membrane protein [Tanacetum cinerariifolium]
MRCLQHPFNRRHVVFLLEINGFGDKLPELGLEGDVFSSSLKNEVVIEDVETQLSDEEEFSLVSLNDPMSRDMEFTDQDLTNFASWLYGSYVTASKSLTGELTVPLANDAQLELYMLKVAFSFSICHQSLIVLIYFNGMYEASFNHHH